MRKIKSLLLVALILAFSLSLFACAAYDASGSMGGGYFGSSGGVKNEAAAPEMDDTASGESGDDSKVEEVPPEDVVTLPSGMITAGAWVDNDFYLEWLDLFSQGAEGESACGKFYEYTTGKPFDWGFNSFGRVKVNVKCGEENVAGANVSAMSEDGKYLYGAVTDAQGNAYLFPNTDNGKIVVNCGDEEKTVDFTLESRDIELNFAKAEEVKNLIEIMLVVDVTGSMGDELSFLKAELADVIGRIAVNDDQATIRLAMLFYRDKTDSVIFDYYDFVDVTNPDGLERQQMALNKQRASGGGDYPEAVDEALELAVGKQWSDSAKTKIIFHVLDAPAHKETDKANNLVNATKSAAEQGIRICPIICSGADLDTEYTMRHAAIYTGGTFIFVTDDSGIGNSHYDPEIPNVTIELLNSLMVRLVNGYHTGLFADPIYWKEDPNLATK